MRDYAAISKRLRRYSENCVAYKLDADFADAVSDAADAIEELLAERDKALNRLCEFCGVCSEKSRRPFECEIAGFAPPTENGVE